MGPDGGGAVYIYDGNLVIQERDQFNVPRVTYTRGKDLSGSLEGAGGIGGMLARTDNTLVTSAASGAHVYYAADGNGNVTCLVDTNQTVVARYVYDPFGNTLAATGPMAEANLYRFSSKELHEGSGLVYYLYRFYDPNLQRWPNRDPIGEEGGFNLYGFTHNNPIDLYDLDGRIAPVVGGLIIVVGDVAIIVSVGCLLSKTCRDAVGELLRDATKELCKPKAKPKEDKDCMENLVKCIDSPWQPDWNQEKFGKRKDCNACYRECINDGKWPSYKCPVD